MSKLWDKKQGDQVDRSWFYEFTANEDRAYDDYLIPFDIKCNLAQNAMLHKIGIMSDDDFTSIHTALVKYYNDWVDGKFHLIDDDEDVHSAIENRLTTDCGDAGKKIHTGRSRNDQVQTDIRLYIKAKLLEVMREWVKIVQKLEKIAQNNKGVFFCGYTHTQPAMPTSVDAWAYGYIDMILCDLSSMRQSFEQIDRNPLGSAAGFGVPYLAIDRELTTSLLNFSETQHAVTAVQLSRGKLEKQVAQSLENGLFSFNRMATDVIHFANPEVGIVELSEDQTSGSSIMPQKRNPDAWELIRSGYGQISGHVHQLTMAGVNLIGGYHRDLQVTKKHLIDAFLCTDKLNLAVIHCLNGLRFDADRCEKSLTNDVFATHKAIQSVLDGSNFRDAYKLSTSTNDAELDTHKSKLNKSYKVEGFPGNPAHGFYQDKISSNQQWLDDRIHGQKEADEHLFNLSK